MATKQTLAEQKNDPTFSHVVDELKWRGLIALSTDEDALRKSLSDGSDHLLLRF